MLKHFKYNKYVPSKYEIKSVIQILLEINGNGKLKGNAPLGDRVGDRDSTRPPKTRGRLPTGRVSRQNDVGADLLSRNARSDEAKRTNV